MARLHARWIRGDSVAETEYSSAERNARLVNSSTQRRRNRTGMRVLVTGACGYKGTVLVPKLLNAGHDVTAVDTMWFGNYLKPHKNLIVERIDVRDSDKIGLDGLDAIIHLSSIANDPCGDLNPKLTWEVSALATIQLEAKPVGKALRRSV